MKHKRDSVLFNSWQMRFVLGLLKCCKVTSCMPVAREGIGYGRVTPLTQVKEKTYPPNHLFVEKIFSYDSLPYCLSPKKKIKGIPLPLKGILRQKIITQSEQEWIKFILYLWISRCNPMKYKEGSCWQYIAVNAVYSCRPYLCGFTIWVHYIYNLWVID